MWTQTTRGKKCGPAALVFSLGAPAGGAHRELMAPGSDYQAAVLPPAARPGTIPYAARLSWGAALLAFSLLLAGSGCAHKELLAPCSDYKAVGFPAGGAPRSIPCDTPLQMQRPPWVTASEARTPAAQEG